jgi:D-serine deaminase-like pyridoxal phosphate-dependent protein
VVAPDKLARVSALAKVADIKLSVDSAGPLNELSRISSEMGSNVGVILEVDTSMGRGGIRAVERGVELAKLATELPGVTFKGVMSHQTLGPDMDTDRESRFIEGRQFIQKCLDVRDAIEAAGIPVDIVSTGETWTYDVAPEIEGVDEVQGGTYALMSTQSDYMDAFQYAVKVLSTVVSRPDANTAIGDVGYRAMTSPGGALPVVDGKPDISVESLEANSIVLRSEGDMPLEVGDQFLLLSAQQDIMVNRWDQFVAVRDGAVEAVWPILARGCHH